MKIVFLSHTAMGGAFVVGSHHLACELVQLGHTVVHLSVPVTPAHLFKVISMPLVRTRFKRWMQGGETINGVRDRVLATLLPWKLTGRSELLMRAYSGMQYELPGGKEMMREMSSAELVIADEPRLLGMLEKHVCCPLIYRATDLYALMRSDKTIITVERALCRVADALVATSACVADHLRNLSGRTVTVVSNGVDYRHFATPVPQFEIKPGKPLPGLREDRAVYVGAFDKRFGGEAFLAAARALPNKRFILAGPGSEVLKADSRLSNVIALGSVRYEQLPALLQSCAVGVLPMSADPANAGRSPMKFYEYAASGLAIAATSSDEMQHRQLPTLSLAHSENDFPEAVESAFSAASDQQAIASARHMAQEHGWSSKAELLLNIADAARVSKRLASSERQVRPIRDELRVVSK